MFFFFFFRTHRSWRSAVVAENSPRKLQTGDDDRAGIGGIKFSFYVSLFLLTSLSSCARFDSINLLLLAGSLFMPRPSLLGPNRQRTLFVPEKTTPKAPGMRPRLAAPSMIKLSYYPLQTRLLMRFLIARHGSNRSRRSNEHPLEGDFVPRLFTFNHFIDTPELSAPMAIAEKDTVRRVPG